MFRARFILILTISLASLCHAVFSQNLWNDLVDVKQSLPGISILCMAEDSQHQLWIGTQTNGLAMVNSDGLIVYNTQNSGLPDNQINTIYIDKNDTKWIGTESNGLVAFDGEKWYQHHLNNSGIGSNTIMDILIDSSGNIWAATYFNGISVYNGREWTVYNTKNSDLLSNNTTALALDQNHVIWVGTMGAGLYSFDGNQWEIFTEQSSNIPNNFVYDIAIDGLNNKWIGTGGGGIGVYNNKFWVHFNTDNSMLSDNHIRGIVITKAGSKWISTYRSGLDNFDGQRWFHFHKENSGLPNDEITCLTYVEPQELLIGTRHEGVLSFYDTLMVSHQGYDESFATVKTQQILTGSDNKPPENQPVKVQPLVIQSGSIVTSGPDPMNSEKGQDWYAGFYFGSSVFKGDLDVTNPTSLLGLYSFSAGRKLSEKRYFDLELITQFDIGMLKGGKNGYAFRNNFKQMMVAAKADLSKNIPTGTRWQLFKPFVYIGIGVINFRSILWDIDGEIINGYGYKIADGDNINYNLPKKDQSKYKMVIPLGLGTAVEINQTFDWNFIFASAYHNSDKLDAKVARANDKYLFFTTGFNYKF